MLKIASIAQFILQTDDWQFSAQLSYCEHRAPAGL